MRPARTLVSILLLFTSLIAFMPASAAPVAQERQATITSPRDGAQLTGVVQISGTATDPKFDHYELNWAAQSAPDNWQVIAVVHNQIANGSLGTWIRPRCSRGYTCCGCASCATKTSLSRLSCAT